MRMVDLIEKKRNGHELNKAEIDFIIEGYTKGDFLIINYRHLRWRFTFKE